MRKTETYGEIREGKLHIIRRRQFTESIARMQPGRVTVTVERLYRKKSPEQNAFYWGVIVNEFCEGFHDMTGEWITKEDAHELLKVKCNGREIANEKTGETMTVGQTTTQLTTVQMSEYWDRCREFVFEWFGREIPDPNEQTELIFQQSAESE